MGGVKLPYLPVTSGANKGIAEPDRLFLNLIFLVEVLVLCGQGVVIVDQVPDLFGVLYPFILQGGKYGGRRLTGRYILPPYFVALRVNVSYGCLCIVLHAGKLGQDGVNAHSFGGRLRRGLVPLILLFHACRPPCPPGR